ncbi:MAG: LPS export ABC transporter periplasmic protein LptC [Rhodospirillales bacterium]
MSPPVDSASPSAPSGRWRHRIKALRWLLAAVAIGLVTFVVLWPEVGPEQGRLKLAGGQVNEVVESNKDTAIDATYRGVDKYGRPFQVVSPHTESADPERGTLDLTMPVADMTMSDGRRVHLTANRGIYDPTAKTVDLWDNVVFIDENGYRVETSQATVQLNEATVSGPNAVTGTASFGEVDGIGFRLVDGGDQVFVYGPATMHITSATPLVK